MSWILRTFRILGSLCVAAFILCALIVAIRTYGDIAPTADSDNYESILAQYRNEYTAHFPKAIPAHAKNFKIFHEPGFMQGATRFQLRLVVTSQEIAKIRNDLDGKFVSRTLGDRKFSDSENMMPRRISSDKSKNRVSANFEIFTIASTPDDEWNHPKLSGIAISDELNEVLYWYEDW